MRYRPPVSAALAVCDLLRISGNAELTQRGGCVRERARPARNSVDRNWLPRPIPVHDALPLAMESERQRRSIIPIAFWYFSLAGGMTLFGYAVHRLDPVFITGQPLGLLVYTRNLLLIGREKRASPPPA